MIFEVARTALLVAQFLGAFIGGYTAERFGGTPITFAQLAKCLVGGMSMGWGSLLIPGDNDGLTVSRDAVAVALRLRRFPKWCRNRRCFHCG